jgi:hypothetical protein
MVQAIENLSTITGKIVSRRPHPRLEGYDLVELELERVEAVAGKANLLESQQGATIQVAVRRELLGNAAPDARLRCRAKRTPDGAICEARPDPEDFSIQ